MRKLRKNDEVIVIAGSNKGSVGKILKIDWKTLRVTVDKVNMVKKHVKPSQTEPDGGIKEFEASMAISNVALKTGKDSHGKVGFKTKDDVKVRFAKKTGKAV